MVFGILNMELCPPGNITTKILHKYLTYTTYCVCVLGLNPAMTNEFLSTNYSKDIHTI